MKTFPDDRSTATHVGMLKLVLPAEQEKREENQEEVVEPERLFDELKKKGTYKGTISRRLLDGHARGFVGASLAR